LRRARGWRRIRQWHLPADSKDCGARAKTLFERARGPRLRKLSGERIDYGTGPRRGGGPGVCSIAIPRTEGTKSLLPGDAEARLYRQASRSPASQRAPTFYNSVAQRTSAAPAPIPNEFIFGGPAWATEESRGRVAVRIAAITLAGRPETTPLRAYRSRELRPETPLGRRDRRARPCWQIRIIVRSTLRKHCPSSSRSAQPPTEQLQVARFALLPPTQVGARYHRAADQRRRRAAVRGADPCRNEARRALPSTRVLAGEDELWCCFSFARGDVFVD